MTFRYIAAALIALAAPAGLAAQDINITLDQTLVENFDGNAVEEALGAFNATVNARSTQTGAPALSFAFPGGLSATAQPGTCREKEARTGCTGLVLSAFFDLPPGKTPADMPAIVNTFNATHNASQVVYDAKGTSRLIHYISADFGITKTNLVVQIYGFRQAAQALSRQLFGAPAETPAAAPPAPAEAP